MNTSKIYEILGILRLCDFPVLCHDGQLSSIDSLPYDHSKAVPSSLFRKAAKGSG